MSKSKDGACVSFEVVRDDGVGRSLSRLVERESRKRIEQLVESAEREMFQSIERDKLERERIDVGIAENEAKRRAFFARLELRVDGPRMSSDEVERVRAEYDVLDAEWRALIERRRVIDDPMRVMGSR